MTERSYNVNTDLLREKVDLCGGVSAIANKLGYKKQRFSHWVTGTNRVPESAIPKLCETLDIPAETLIEDDFKNFVKFVYPRLTIVYP
jgi:transcriptional regulator with XRE-family HTH domain